MGGNAALGRELNHSVAYRPAKNLNSKIENNSLSRDFSQTEERKNRIVD
jgi:hypothetical protein